MINLLVTGAKGQLGNELKAISDDYKDLSFTFTDVAELDITDPDAINEFLAANAFDFCINCAAYTAVDKAESDMDMAFQLNSTAVKHIASITKQHDITLIHISTDFVFDGKKSFPYVEDDPITPLSIYAKSKWRGEEECLANNDKSLIIRTSWLYSSYGNNFVKTMQRLGHEREELGVVYDQVGTPTYAADLARVLLDIISQFEKDKRYGIFHYSNEGICSWYDFAVAIMEISNINCYVKPIETSEYPTPAKRGHYTVLNKKKIKITFGIGIPHWRESLKKCIRIIQQDA